MSKLSLCALGALLAGAGCDAGIRLHPEGGTGGEGEYRTEGVALRVEEMGVLAGSRYLSGHAFLRNRSELPVRFETAQLIARGKSYDLASEPLERTRTVHPGQVEEYYPFWDLKSTVGEVCAEGCTVVFRITLGDSPREMAVRFRRVLP